MKIKTLMLLPILIGAVHAVAEDGAGCQLPATPPDTTAPQAAFDSYSWQMFVALNWPASNTQRGEPDCNKALSASGLRVWQTYKTDTQTFLANGANPGSWNAGFDLQKIDFSINSIAKADQDVAIEAHQEAVGGWLIDQQGNPTYFQRWVNEAWYDYVVDNQFYNSDNFGNKTLINFPWNAMELKSSWRILTEKDDVSLYITQRSQVATFNDKGQPTGNNTSVTLGLVGLHIVYKPEGYPQWIWATFEHNLNVPPAVFDEDLYKVVNDPEEGVSYSYFNQDATTVNMPPCNLGDPSECQPFTKPTPLTRLTPIRDDAAAANSTYTSQSPVEGTLLTNYSLITTQWPTRPNDPSVTFGDPSPTISANITMESYIQPTSNCMACHGAARLPGTQAKSDFSFLLNEAKSVSN